MKKYHFVLFENFHQAKNHKFDVLLIARMLASKGMRVAILNIYGEDLEDKYSGIEIINLPFSSECPPRSTKFSLFGFFIWQNRYFAKVCDFLEQITENVYIGSYHFLMPASLLRLKINCYSWGLRSNRMGNFLRLFKKRNPIHVLNLILLRYCFLKNRNNRLFVSNEVIREEFIRLGVDPMRLIVREERCVEAGGGANIELASSSTSFLVIGRLRPSKHVVESIRAFKLGNTGNAMMYLCGYANKDYEREIQEEIAGDRHIVRINKYLDEKEFADMFRHTHYVLFADEQYDCSITNGTLIESLIHHRPVIVPRFQHFSRLLSRWKVGIPYEPGVIKSYSEAIAQACSTPFTEFMPAIEDFLVNINFDTLADKLVSDIKQANTLPQ